MISLNFTGINSLKWYANHYFIEIIPVVLDIALSRSSHAFLTRNLIHFIKYRYELL